MALILFGNGIADIRGSINGTTFARNRSGAYARNRTVPINPGTIDQTLTRSLFGNVSNGWANLTEAQQDTWRGEAALQTRLNKLGQSYVPSGRQLYMEVNSSLAQANLPQIVTPGSSFPPNAVEFLEVSATTLAGNLATLSITNTNLIQPPAIVVDAAPATTTKTNLSNQFRQIAVVSSPGSSESVVAEYIARFGLVQTVGSRIFVRVTSIDPANGLRSAAVIAAGTITGT